jgi:hypothetical protein
MRELDKGQESPSQFKTQRNATQEEQGGIHKEVATSIAPQYKCCSATMRGLLMIKREPTPITKNNELIITDRIISDHAKKLARTYDPSNSPRVTEAERKILKRPRRRLAFT